jgi:DNA-binding NarL/FixJ family response regulator
MAQVFFSQGFISLGQGDYAAACTLMEQSLEIARELDRKWDMVSYLEGLAAVVAAQGEPVRAVWFMSAAQAGREAIGTPLQSLLQAMHEFTMASVRTQLGEQAFDAAWTEGRMMTPEHVLLSLEPLPASKPVLSTQSSAAVAPPSHAGLTPREMEVLCLLAQGLTSAQIAERLVIGLVTVNSHVRSIYSKLGVTSRSAATRYAIEHKLL